KWIIHKNHHEAIISEQVFYSVQEQFNKRSQAVMASRGTRHSNAHLFSNLIKCSICGATFTFKKKKIENYVPRYSCIDYEQKGKAGCGHKRNTITEAMLIAAVKADLEQISEEDFKSVKDYYKSRRNNQHKSRSTSDLKRVEKQIESKTKLSLNLLENYSNGLTGDIQYKLQNEAIEKDLNKLFEEKEKLLNEMDTSMDFDNERETISIIENLLDVSTETWTNEMMKRIIDKIEVDMVGCEVHIFFKFRLPKQLCQYLLP
ncbi:recombinase family protein, partial [Tyzzerella sp. OttesenSCG-928-J15]|nr:recombinase family protein [Tyzzerella sp. OttesenSCG-928-J15]